MGVWARVHAAFSVALLPSLALAPAVGAGLLAAWLASARARRPAASRDAAVVLALVVAAVALRHGGPWTTVLATVAAGAALAAAVVRLDAAVTRAAAVAAGLGATATAIGLAGAAFADAWARGFAQVATATHHPNATAALALALAAASALAWRGGWPERVLGTAGVGASLLLLVLTGSRGGLLGLAMMLAVLALLALGRLLALARRTLAGELAAVGGALVLLVALQTVLMAPERVAPWWPRVWAQVDAVTAEANAAASESDTATPEIDAAPPAAAPLVGRLRLLREPLGTSGGRLAAWKLAREMIAHRPTLGYGFDAIERVYAPGAASELANPLAHPHHGVLTMVLQGGTLFAVAVLVLLAGIGLRLARAAVRGDAAAGVAAAFLIGLIAMELLDSVVRMGQVGGTALIALLLATAGRDRAADEAALRARPAEDACPTTPDPRVANFTDT